jgi:cellulose synthase (UDP-forming)
MTARRLRRVLGLALLALAAGPRGAFPAPDEATEATAEGMQTDSEETEIDVPSADSTDAVVQLPLVVRADRAPAGARIALTLAPVNASAGMARAVQVRVNDLDVARLAPTDVETSRTFDLPASALAERNLVTLKVVPEQELPCGRVPAGSWRLLRRAAVTLRTAPLPLPDDLGLLPLPFVDRDVDREPVVAVALAGAPTPERLRIAGLVAGWLGTIAGVPLRFEVHLGSLPARPAIVLLEGRDQARALGLPAPAGPELRMTDHPALGATAKLLVVAGRNLEELGGAAARLAEGVVPLAGAAMQVDPPPPRPPERANHSPRWLPNASIPFAQYPGAGDLSHEGLDDGTIALRFRIAPDLWIWPSEEVLLEIGYAEVLPPPVPPPRLDVELNGQFLATLAPLSPGRGEAFGRARIPVRRERLRGYDELLIHVRYPATVRRCAIADATPRVRITPDSVLHLEGQHFAPLPDVSLFLYDGFPFTRFADLSGTTAVLPDQPRAPEIATFLSVVAHLASIIGRAGARLEVTTASAALSAPTDRDLLVIGVAEGNPVFARYGDLMPIAFAEGRASPRPPTLANRLLEALAASPAEPELARSRLVLGGLDGLAAVIGVESPFRQGKSVVLLTATSAADMPAMGDLLGYAEGRRGRGDLLVAAGGRRWTFSIGPTYGSGTLGLLARIRWFLAVHALLLLPAVAGGSLLAAVPARTYLARRERLRRAGRGAER